MLDIFVGILIVIGGLILENVTKDIPDDWVRFAYRVLLAPCGIILGLIVIVLGVLCMIGLI